MAKKNFDNFLSNVGKAARLSPSEIEEMTKEIHNKSAAPEVAPAPPPAEALVEMPAAPRAQPQPRAGEPNKRGRKPLPPEEERLIRVSVDLPESVIIDLKGRVVRERVPMKDFIRRLVERELKK